MMMYKPLADSTLMNMTKKEIIEHLRVAEHNHKVAEETINQQYINCQKLLRDKYNQALDDFAVQFKAHCKKFTTKSISDADIDWVKTELAEK